MRVLMVQNPNLIRLGILGRDDARPALVLHVLRAAPENALGTLAVLHVTIAIKN